MSRMRLDELLVRRGVYATRSRASDAIRRGTVRVEGVVAVKPGVATAVDAVIDVRDPAITYVSRAALKLVHALDHFCVDVKGLAALDLGASTGGFTQVLLERGATRVVAVEVGHGQMAPVLASDPRVRLLEGVNARDLTGEQVGVPDIVVADISFISLKLALPPALDAARPDARLVALIKPQFKLGRAAVAGTGTVADATLHLKACDNIAGWLTGRGWRVIGVTASPLVGGDGNREFLIAAEKPC